MWNCSAPSSLLMPFGDDYVKCESSSSAVGAAGFDKILTAADYGHLRHHLPSFQAPTLFATRGRGPETSYIGIGDGSIYSGGDVRPSSLMQFGAYTDQAASSPPPPPPATHMLTWTAEGGEPMAGDGSGSKRLKTTRAATTQGPQRRLQGRAKPKNHAAAKAPCKRSQKLGDKITALQQLVSPYGKTDTASVLHEAAACIRSLHEQIQILAAPFPGVGSSPSSQDPGEEPATSLRRQGLCVAPLSAAVASLVSDNARGHGHSRTDMDMDMGGGFFGAL